MKIHKKGQIVVISRKKKNGYPRGFEIGDRVKIVGVSYFQDRKKLTYHVVKVTDNETYLAHSKIHFSYISTIKELRSKKIKNVLKAQNA